MKTSIAVLLPLITLFSAMLPSVEAHGFVTKFTVDGKSYKGNTPNGKSNPSPIRLINSINPVKGANNKNLMCGQNAKPASLVADVNPGSKISFAWGNPDGSRWPHNTGPIMTYMASCGTTSCDKFDPSNAKWFKIDETGRKSNGNWVQQDFMDGKEYSTSVPQNLKAGGYLIRHEIIALHLANSKGGAEFYPSCIQVNVKGSGTGNPSSNNLVSFPGAYSDSDPGIFDKNVFDTKAKYSFPGPALVKLGAGGGSSTPADDGGSEPASSSVKPSGTNPSPVPSPSGKNNNVKACNSEKKRMIVKKELPSVAEPITNYTDSDTKDAITKPQPGQARPHHLSRVMGRLTHINAQW